MEDGRVIRSGAATVLLVLFALALRGFYVNMLGLAGLPAAVSLGFILVASYTFSRLFVPLRLPRLCAYLLMGMLCGPFALNLITQQGVRDLRLIEKIAIALIALQAGGEIQWALIRRRYRALLFLTGSLVVVVMFGTIGSFLALAPLIEFFREAPFSVVLAAAAIMGVSAMAKSPATAVAVIKETRSRGILSETVISVLLMLDVLAVICFAIALGLAEHWTSQAGGIVGVAAGAGERAGFQSSDLLALAWEIMGALPVGAAIGMLSAVYLRFVRGNYLVFVCLLCLLLVEISYALHVELIMMAVMVGFAVENLSDQGDDLMRAIDRSYLPVYVAFFTLAGANVNFQFLAGNWVLALAFVLLIGALTWAGCAVGGKLGKLEKPHRSYVFTGLIAQAGLNISFATVVRDRLAGYALTEEVTLGKALETLILARVAIKQMLGPILFRFALEKVGEVGGGAKEDRRDKRATERESVEGAGTS